MRQTAHGARLSGPCLHEETGEMILDSYCPGITIDEILDNMEFTVNTEKAREAVPPTDHELKILREQCDPQRLIL